MSDLCHIVKRVDVLLSTSLFMNTEQSFYVLHSFLPAGLVNSYSLHLLIKLPTQTSLAVPSNNHIVVDSSMPSAFCQERRL